MLVQRTLASTRRLIAACDSSSRASHALLVPSGAPGTHRVHIHIGRQKLIHIKIKALFKNFFLEGWFGR